MAVKAPPKKASGSAAGLVIALLFLALALGGHGLHLAAPSGGGHPPFIGRMLAHDPCPEGTPSDKIVGTWHRLLDLHVTGHKPQTHNKTSRNRVFKLDCEDWRKIVDDITFYDRLHPDEWPFSRQVLDCIGNIARKGTVSPAGDLTVVTLVAEGRGPYTDAGFTADAADYITSVLLRNMTWQECVDL